MTLMVDRSGDVEEEGALVVSVLSPTPRPMASAAKTARRQQHGQKATARHFLSSLSSFFTSGSASATGGAEECAVGGDAGARRVRPSSPLWDDP
jgi:hypothetical protein